MSDTRRIISNVFTGWVAVVLRAVVALIMVPFLLAQLGRDGYGIIALFGVLMSLTQLADLGLRQALSRELAEMVARDDEQGFSELASTAFFLYLLIGSMVSVLCFISAEPLVLFMKVPHYLQAETILLFRFYGCTAAILGFMVPVFSSILTGCHRYDTYNTITIIASLLSSAGLLLVLSFSDAQLGGWVIVMIGFYIAQLILLIRAAWRERPNLQIKWSLASRSRSRALFKLGGYMYMVQLANALADRSDPLVISRFFGPLGVAAYNPGLRISQMTRPLVTMLSNQLHPLTTRQHVENNMQKMQQLLIHGTRFTLLTGALVSTTTFLIADDFCRVWLAAGLGEDYKIAALIMKGWAMIDFLLYLGGVQWGVLLGMKKLKVMVFSLIAAAVINLLLSIYFVGYTSLGIPGVLLATITITALHRPLMALYTARVCQLTFRNYTRQAYLRPLLVLSSLVLTGVLLKGLMPLDSLWQIMLYGLTMAAAWVLYSWGLGLAGSERILLGERLKELLKRSPFKKQQLPL